MAARVWVETLGNTLLELVRQPGWVRARWSAAAGLQRLRLRWALQMQGTMIAAYWYGGRGGSMGGGALPTQQGGGGGAVPSDACCSGDELHPDTACWYGSRGGIWGGGGEPPPQPRGKGGGC